jgi:SAM-dependent methyltransferase
MPDYKAIYENDADRYQELVAHEDYENNLLKTIDSLYPLNNNIEVADIGSGTGRVSFLLANRVRRVVGVEPSRGMRERAASLKAERGAANVEFLPGGYDSLPLADGAANLVIDGWSLGHYFVHYCRPDWEPKIGRAFAEMRRVTRPGGIILLVENLGLLADEPVRSEWGAALFDHFEHDLGYSLTTIRTDCRFASLEQAVDLVTFFFGEDMGRKVKSRRSPIVPEWTGVWWKRV